MPVTPQMLRHFAVLTVMITGCLAMFADGENRELIGEKLKERQARNVMLAADAQRGDKRKAQVAGLTVAPGMHIQSGGDDAPASGGASSGTGSLNPDDDHYEQDGLGIPATPTGGLHDPDADPVAVTQASGSIHKGTTKAQALRAKSAKPKPPRAPTREDMARMLAASRARSSGGEPVNPSSGD